MGENMVISNLSEFDEEIEREVAKLKKIDEYKKGSKKSGTGKALKGEPRKEGTGKTTGKNEPFLKDSGGFCMHESKSTFNKIDWKTGKLIEAITNGTKLDI